MHDIEPVAEESIFDFDDSYARALGGLFAPWQPAPVPEPRLVALNRSLAAELGVDPARLESDDGVALLAGNLVPPGANPIAMAYSGHQFGGYSPLLGDGRALLLGEAVDPDGGRWDIHLKGSGRTPFARGGDGKAVLGPMLREFLVAEAMHALGLPTTRALAVVATGEMVQREGPVPGAVLTRVAASHLRVGTFEYAARHEDVAVIRGLADYAIARHHPSLAGAPDRYMALLGAVIEAQAALVAQWMLVGFIHGVMNTDNMTISGEGIDYGPCAFMDRFDPATVYSSIDHGGRYSYRNQPAIAQWNLTRFAETLLRLVDADGVDAAIAAATDKLEAFDDRFRHHWVAGMRAKLGLGGDDSQDGSLADGFLDLLAAHRVDYTNAFRALGRHLRGDVGALAAVFDDPLVAVDWVERWHDRLAADGRDRAEVADAMDTANPIYVPRNHLLEAALSAAHEGDLGPFGELLDVVTHPFDERSGLERYTEPAPDGFDESYRTFCGT